MQGYYVTLKARLSFNLIFSRGASIYFSASLEKMVLSPQPLKCFKIKIFLIDQFDNYETTTAQRSLSFQGQNIYASIKWIHRPYPTKQIWLCYRAKTFELSITFLNRDIFFAWNRGMKYRQKRSSDLAKEKTTIPFMHLIRLLSILSMRRSIYWKPLSSNYDTVLSRVPHTYGATTIIWFQTLFLTWLSKLFMLRTHWYIWRLNAA